MDGCSGTRLALERVFTKSSNTDVRKSPIKSAFLSVVAAIGLILLAHPSKAPAQQAPSSPDAPVPQRTASSLDLIPATGLVPLAQGTGEASGSAPCAGCKMTGKGFFGRIGEYYLEDWAGTLPSGKDLFVSEAPKRGWPSPVSDPPYPFSDWPYGGSPDIGSPDTTMFPLTYAIYTSHTAFGDFLKEHNIKLYGWVELGANYSTSNGAVAPAALNSPVKYSNAPTAYAVLQNSIQLDQLTLYVEKKPDTVQHDHFDWGFRFTNLYGLDYRYTTTKGILSAQLLSDSRPFGNRYGYDPVMFYVDLFWGQVMEGLNIRIGRYISLPDIEAQLAPDNYTYSHSLLYTFDCYTQTGINGTLKISNAWLFQAGLSGSCDVAPWQSSDTKLTGNACLGYNWNEGRDDVYVCANTINDGNYAYNNLTAYYATWYHKFPNSNFHMDTEYWYQYEKNTPSIFGPIPTETNANGAWCDPGENRCLANEWAIVNYINYQIDPSNAIIFRNEFFDDIRGQRTGIRTQYSEHLLSWNHWIGTTILIRPELRFERSYDNHAYDGGVFNVTAACGGVCPGGGKRDQFMLASDIIWHY